MSEERISSDKGFWITLTIAGLALWKAVEIASFLVSGVLRWTAPN